MPETAVDLVVLRRSLAGLAISAIVGLLFLLNQFGAILERSYPIVGIASPIWQINAVLGAFNYYAILLLFVIVAGACHAALASNREMQQAYGQGLIAGFTVLPMLSAVLTVVALAGWLLLSILKFLGLVLAPILNAIAAFLTWLLTPVQWLIDNLLVPAIRFLATPFIWLWENVLQPVLRVLLFPFTWLVANVIAPILQFIGTYILKPILVIAAVIVFGGLALSPFAIVGHTVIRGFRNAATGMLNPNGAFAQGVATGFICFDALLMAVFNAVGIPATPAIALVVTVAVPLIYFGRMLRSQREWSLVRWQALPFQSRAQYYWKNERFDAIMSCALIAAFAIVLVVSQDSNN